MDTLGTVVDHSAPGREVFVFQVNVGADVQEMVSILAPGTVFEHGLCTEAILGRIRPGPTDGRQITPERFQENPAFVQFLRGLISARVYTVEGLRRAAEQQGEGYVYLIDARTPEPDGQVPPADVIGAVSVHGGSLVAASYRHNPNHRLLTNDGFFKLPTELETILLTDLHARCAQPR
jgi:hypothetical protein